MHERNIVESIVIPLKKRSKVKEPPVRIGNLRSWRGIMILTLTITTPGHAILEVNSESVLSPRAKAVV
jgi:hypothetical protein